MLVDHLCRGWPRSPCLSGNGGSRPTAIILSLSKPSFSPFLLTDTDRRRIERERIVARGHGPGLVGRVVSKYADRHSGLKSEEGVDRGLLGNIARVHCQRHVLGAVAIVRDCQGDVCRVAYRHISKLDYRGRYIQGCPVAVMDADM